MYVESDECAERVRLPVVQFFISLNQFKGEALDAVIANLPLKKELLGTLSVLNNAMGDYEQNEITESQIAAANAKGWTVYAGGKEYPGMLVNQ